MNVCAFRFFSADRILQYRLLFGDGRQHNKAASTIVDGSFLLVQSLLLHTRCRAGWVVVNDVSKVSDGSMLYLGRL